MFAQRSRHFFETLSAFVMAHHGKPYEESALVLAKAAIKRNASADERSFFCSHLVGSALASVGVLGPHVVTANLVPRDFATDALHLARGVLEPTKVHAASTEALAASSPGMKRLAKLGM